MILEILISTMNKTSFSFLNEMFPNEEIRELNILIINQTRKGEELISKLDNIRVINSFEKGLSKSRNLAIKNSVGDICLIADDDTQYVAGFDKIIMNTFLEQPNASVIRFKIDTFCGKDYKLYPKQSKVLRTTRDISNISSVEIAFKRKCIINNGILFNLYFGLGSNFSSGEEYLFLKDVLKMGLDAYFENKVIVKHTLERTTKIASSNFIKTKAALYYIDYNILSYLFLLKLIFFLVRKHQIALREIQTKYKIGLEGIKEFKSLKRA